MQFILKSPSFPDAEKTRNARLLHKWLLAVYVGAPLYILMVLLSNDPGLFPRAALGVFFIISTLFLLPFLHRGYVHQTAIALSLMMLVILIAFVLLDGGLNSPSYNWMVVVIVSGGLLTNTRGLILLTAINVLVSLGVFILQSAGILVPQVLPLAYIWTVDTIGFVLTAILLVLVSRNMRQTFEYLQDSEQIVRETNRHLMQQMSEREQLETERDRLFKLSIDLMCITDFHGYFKRVNPAFSRVLGYTEDELLAIKIKDLLHPEDWLVSDEQGAKLTAGQSVVGFRNRYRCKNGAYVWLEWSAVPENEVIYAVARNITQEKELEEMRIDLEIQQKMMDLREDFISTMTHELKTPISVIQASKDVLQRGQNRLSDEKRDQYFDRIDVYIKRMTEMIDQIMLINRFRTNSMNFEPQEIELVSFCRSIFNDIKEIGNERQLFVFSSKVELLLIRADPALLRHALSNLLSNAIKYSPDGGIIRLELQREQDHVQMSISDQGIGIPHEDMKTLFQPFVRASNVDTIDGTGLGLAVVKSSIERHGGQIRLDSVVGSGTTFYISLPLQSVQNLVKT